MIMKIAFVYDAVYPWVKGGAESKGSVSKKYYILP